MHQRSEYISLVFSDKSFPIPKRWLTSRRNCTEAKKILIQIFPFPTIPHVIHDIWKINFKVIHPQCISLHFNATQFITQRSQVLCPYSPFWLRAKSLEQFRWNQSRPWKDEGRHADYSFSDHASKHSSVFLFSLVMINDAKNCFTLFRQYLLYTFYLYILYCRIPKVYQLKSSWQACSKHKRINNTLENWDSVSTLLQLHCWLSLWQEGAFKAITVWITGSRLEIHLDGSQRSLITLNLMIKT